MNPPHSLPPKKEVALALLERSSVFLHLDPRRERVAVPPWFKKQPQLVLQIGLNMPVPIHDLHLDDEKVACTLSFNRSPFYCVLPWDSIYAMVGEDGRAMVWPDDIPPEVAAQAQARPAPAAAPQPALKAVGKPRERGDRLEKSDKPEKKDARRPLEVARGSESPSKPKRAAASKKKRDGEATVTPIGGAADADGARAGQAAPSATPEPAPSSPSDGGTQTPQPRPAPALVPSPSAAGSPPRKPKRELPPYLRVIK